MAAFVVVATLFAVRGRDHGERTPVTAAGAGRPGGGAARTAARPARGQADPPAGHGRARQGHGSGSAYVERKNLDRLLDQQLAAALKRIMAGQTGHLAVGVVDRTTGARAVYSGGRWFPTAGIGKVDLLSAVLLRCQADAAMLSPGQRELAARVIDDTDGQAVARLRRMAGGTAGLRGANAQLRLRRTVPAQGRHRGLTRTTVRDQLRLLADLTSARSPLWPASRSYVLGLMGAVPSARAWGITEAATPRTASAIENGSRRTGPRRLWVVDSIGVIHHARQVLEVAVLLDGQPTQQTGTALDERAAVAAVTAVVPVPARP
jgi:hypothetical protein